MGSFLSMPPDLPENVLNDLYLETGFSKTHINSLWVRFRELDQGRKGFLTRQDFRKISELEKNPLSERIIFCFMNEGKQNRHHENGYHNGGDAIIDVMRQRNESLEAVNFEDFVRVFARFKPLKRDSDKNVRNTRHERLKFIFQMFDYDNKGMICTDDLLDILTFMIGGNVTRDQLMSIAFRMMTEADLDEDGVISFEEFCDALDKVDVENKMSMLHLK